MVFIHNLKSSQTWDFCILYNVYISNQFQANFVGGGGGGGGKKPLFNVNFKKKEKKNKFFFPNKIKKYGKIKPFS